MTDKHGNEMHNGDIIRLRPLRLFGHDTVARSWTFVTVNTIAKLI